MIRSIVRKSRRSALKVAAVAGIALAAAASPVRADVTAFDGALPAGLDTFTTNIGGTRDKAVAFWFVTGSAVVGVSWLMVFRPRRR